MEYKMTDKERTLESLIAAHRQGQLAEISLRCQNRPLEADKVWERNVRLSIEIDILVGHMIDEWLGAADLTTTALVDANAKLVDVVKDIKKKIEIASNVVKVMECLDEAIAIAKKVLAA
ncbi:hypothetical protein [Nitrosospira sp. Is2]|uniref:hypothetical protein n=1 Tax=Nitrosospira sp. Is2 TaxID=3080532 RepID=UPI00295540CA|nr:hypothetical protein [Nitrosospira sp. Is2]WON74454.1 hypothetical protein R5L00_02890 [Nitrosospira sp. Is2]